MGCSALGLANIAQGTNAVQAFQAQAAKGRARRPFHARRPNLVGRSARRTQKSTLASLIVVVDAAVVVVVVRMLAAPQRLTLHLHHLDPRSSAIQSMSSRDQRVTAMKRTPW